MKRAVYNSPNRLAAALFGLAALGLAACSSDNDGVQRSVTGPTATPNGEPQAVADSYVVLSGTTLTVSASSGLLSNDNVPVGSATVAVVQGTGPNSSLSLLADGSFSYSHDPNAGDRTDTFVYRLTDEFGQTSDASVQIRANRPPVALSDSFSFPNGPITIQVSDLLLNDSDPDGDAISFGSANPADGAIFQEVGLDATLRNTVNGLVIEVDPDSSATSGQFDYVIHDEFGDEEDTATVFFTFTGSSNPDVFGKNDRFAVARGGALTVSAPGVLLNDQVDRNPARSNPNVRAVLIQGREPRQHDDRDPSLGGAGAFSLNSDGSFTYIHDGSDQKVDTFDYILVDDSTSPARQSAPATVSIDVLEAAQNEAPVARDEVAKVNNGRAVDVPVLYNDTDREEGVPCFVQITNPPACGVVDASLIQACEQKQASPPTLPADNFGVVRYTHTPNDPNKPNCRVQPDTELTDSFSYQVADSNGATDQATVTIRVTTQSNALPVAANDEVGVPANEVVMIDVLANDSDPDGDAVILELVDGLDADGDDCADTPADPDHECNSQRASGSISFDPDTGIVTYTPVSTDILEPPYSDVFEYKINDGRNGQPGVRGGEARASVTVNVRASSVNQAPTACDDPVDVFANDNPSSGCSSSEFANGDSNIPGDFTPQPSRPNDIPVQLFTVPACAERELALNILVNDTDVDPEDRPPYRFQRVQPYNDRNPPRAVFNAPADPTFGVGALRVDEVPAVTGTGSPSDSNNGRRGVIRISDDRRYIYYQHVGGNSAFCQEADFNGDGVVDENDAFVDTFTYVLEDGKGLSDEGLIQVRVVPDRSGNLTGVDAPGCGVAECWGNDQDCDDDDVPDSEDQCPCTPPYDGDSLSITIPQKGIQTSTPVKTVFSNGCTILPSDQSLDNDGDGIAHFTYRDNRNQVCTSRSAFDNCASVFNPNQRASEACETQAVCGSLATPDRDGDGVPDAADNCPDGRTPANENTPQDNQLPDNDQTDSDGDNQGDICDPDNDDDGVNDNDDVCPYEETGVLPDVANPGCPTIF